MPEIDIAEFHVHPCHIIDHVDQLVFELAAVMSGGMSVGPLPSAGGYLDQPSATMASITIMSSAQYKAREYRKKGKK
jgi:hypothetical protein